jgi:hypothetical protein
MKVVTAVPTGAYLHCHLFLQFSALVVTAVNIHNDVSVGSLLIRNVE